MIQDPDSLIATLIATIAIVIVLFFLPALIELKKPKDAGPRLINDDTTKIRISSLKSRHNRHRRRAGIYLSINNQNCRFPLCASGLGSLVFNLFEY